MREELRGPELVGTFACPDGDGPFPGVVALGGSDGGIPTYFLEALVEGGLACLALAYHKGLTGSELGDAIPEDMYELPLEYVESGLRWLAERPTVSTEGHGRVGLVGASKGGELALLAAATFPDLVGPTVAYTPSNCVWQGVSWSNARVARRSTWSRNGQPLPYVPYAADGAPTISARGLSLLPMYDRALDDPEAVADATIPVERAVGPLLLVSGGDDRMWPAARMCRLVVDRMQRNGRGESVRHLHYPDAGHLVFAPDMTEAVTAAPFPMDFGGTVDADAAARADAYPQVIAHLRSLSVANPRP